MTRPKLKLTATHTTDCSCPVSTATGVTESTVVEEERTVSHMLNKDIIGAITCTQDTDLPRNKWWHWSCPLWSVRQLENKPCLSLRSPTTLFSLPDHLHSRTVASWDPEAISPSPGVPNKPTSGVNVIQVTMSLWAKTLCSIIPAREENYTIKAST